MLYWIAVVAVVFLLTYFEVKIAYLLAIMYLYSVVDVLLIQNFYLSSTVYISVNIISTIAKVTDTGPTLFCKKMLM